MASGSASHNMILAAAQSGPKVKGPVKTTLVNSKVKAIATNEITGKATANDNKSYIQLNVAQTHFIPFQ